MGAPFAHSLRETAGYQTPRPLLSLDVGARHSEVGLFNVPREPTAGGLSALARRPGRPNAPPAGFQFVC